MPSARSRSVSSPVASAAASSASTACMLPFSPRYGSSRVNPRSQASTKRPALGVEEPLLPNGQRLLEQVVGAGQRGQPGRAGCEHHEGVGVAGLLVRRLAVRADGGEPAARVPVAQPAEQPAQAGGGEVRVPGPTQQVAEAVDVGHPGGDPGEDRTAQVGLARLVQPRRAARRVREVAPEVQQPVTLRGQHGGRHPLISCHGGPDSNERSAQVGAQQGLVGVGGADLDLLDLSHP